MFNSILSSETQQLEYSIQLFDALRSQELEVVKEVLKQEGELNWPISSSFRLASPCFYIVAVWTEEEYILEGLTYLLDRGANPNWGFPMYPALERKLNKVIELLLSYGAIDLRPFFQPDTHEYRSFRYGQRVPEIIDDPYYLHAIISKESAYQLEIKFKAKKREEEGYISVNKRKKQKKKKQSGWSTKEAGPIWSYERFGVATVFLPDGRFLMIGGEHEDFYDPNFCIYNDIVQVSESGIHLMLYPKTIFPPTDFHTATLYQNKIYIIGNLGYSHTRKVEQTPVFVIDTSNFQVTSLRTKGELPGWISKHNALLSPKEGKIYIFGGEKVGMKDIKANTEVFALDLNNNQWEKVAPDAYSLEYFMERKKEYLDIIHWF